MDKERKRRYIIFLFIQFFVVPNGASQQKYKGPVIESYHVISNIFYRFVTTHVTNHVVYNEADATDVIFNITIPDKAMVTNFTMQVNDTFYNGIITTRELTRETGLTSSGQGHKHGRLATRSQSTNRFIVRERVQGQTTVTFNLTYHELLQRNSGSYDNPIYITPDHPVRNIHIKANITEPQRVIKADLLIASSKLKGGKHNIYLDQYGSTILEYDKTFTLSKHGETVDGKITLDYFVGYVYDAGDILMSRDFFIHFFSPKLSKQAPKDVLFLLDVSGSMANSDRLNKLKEAMTTILATLGKNDRFNVMPFSDVTTIFKKGDLISGSKTTGAKKKIKSLTASGDTDISKAILDGMGYINKHSKNSNKSFIFFLTDGHPTSGISDTRKILELTRATNGDNIPIFTIAFGKDADWHLVKSLAAENFGLSKRILARQSAAAEIIKFYKVVSSSLMSRVEFSYYINGKYKTNYNVIRQNLKNYYKGSELVVAGRLYQRKEIKRYKYLKGTVTGRSVLGQVSLSKSSPQYSREHDIVLERMWAYLVIENLVRQHELALDSTQRKRINTKLQTMSLKYNVVTPVTVMLADASSDDIYGEDIKSFGMFRPLKLNSVDSRPLVLKAERKGPENPPSRFTSEGGRDPHFVIKSPNVEYPVCFSVIGRSNDIIQLLNDPESGLRINIRIHHLGDKHKLFITEIGVMFNGFSLIAKRHYLYINKKAFHWNITKTRLCKEATVEISDGSKAMVELEDGMIINIQKHATHSCGYFFNIGIEREEKLSAKTSGLLGLFLHLTSRIPHDHRENTRLLKTTLNGYSLMSKARLVERVHPIRENNITCWSLPLNGDIMKTTILFKVNKLLK